VSSIEASAYVMAFGVVLLVFAIALYRSSGPPPR